jgi:soluble lytic murein transglycosylase
MPLMDLILPRPWRAIAPGVALVLGLATCSSVPQRPDHDNRFVASTPGADTLLVRPGADTPAVRAQFRAALARVGQAGSVPVDPPALRAYAVYPYLVAARLQAALAAEPPAARNSPLDARIAAFLQRHADEPVTRALAHDWLVDLAMRRQWPTFLAQVGDFAWAADDPVLACDMLSARLATGAPDTSGALALWSQPVRQPTACDTVFGWLQQQGLLTPERVEARARAALTAGDAGLGLELAAQLPDAQAQPLLEWAALLQRPEVSLEALAQMSAKPVEADALAAGVSRLALLDSAAAEAVLPALLIRPDMTPELAGQLRRAVALGLAYDHAAGAAAALQDVPESARDDTVREWGVRIALWTGAWRQALDWLDQLSPAAAAEPRWSYWRARALEVTAGEAAATPLLEALARLRDYYGYLAADQLQLPYDLEAHPTPGNPAMQAGLAARPGLIRAHELFECGLTDSAELEWTVALKGAMNAQRIQAAQLAEGWGWYAQAIAELGQANDLDDVALRYPRPYAALVMRASALTGVPTDWLFAVMRQESLFRVDAVSRADAHGLMQLLPTTASAVARRWHVAYDSSDSLFGPATAVTLGAAHLRDLLNQYDGALALALAAYNAGPAPLTRWRPLQPMDADIWIENIPYGETRDYVEHVVEHIIAYRWARGAPLPRLSSLLPAVGPVTVNVARSSHGPSS